MLEANALKLHARYQGTVPEMYDRYLGPVMFKPYAEDLARRVMVHAHGPVLEIACGTGILTQQLRVALPSTTRLVATDLNEPMIEYARSRVNGGPIEWRPADASALPFESASFAAVACQFGLMFVPDKKAAVREIRRVLVDGGLLAFNVWGDFERNPFSRVAHETVRQFFPTDPTSFFQVPFGFCDPDLWQRLLRDGGFGDITMQPVAFEANSPTARSFAEGLIKGYPVGIEINERGLPVETIVDKLALGLARLGGDNPFRSTMQALVVTARATTD